MSTVKNESIVTKKRVICQTLLSWKMLNSKFKRYMKTWLGKSRTSLHHSLIQIVRCEVMCHSEMCGPKEGKYRSNSNRIDISMKVSRVECLGVKCNGGRYRRLSKYAEETKPKVSPNPWSIKVPHQMAIPQCQRIEQSGYAPVWNDDNMKRPKDPNITYQMLQHNEWIWSLSKRWVCPSVYHIAPNIHYR